MDEEAFVKLTKDLREGVKTMTPNEARFLVDAYYQMQENRIRAAGQVRSMEKPEKPEPHGVLDWIAANSSSMENQVRAALSDYSQSKPIGRWAESNWGIGPVISAGLIANIDITQCPTVGHIYRFAGLDPSVKWMKTEEFAKWVKSQGGASDALIIEAVKLFGRKVETLRKFATTDSNGDTIKLTNESLAKALSRRPWNASLKTLCWKMGDCFLKVSGKDDSVYGRLYRERAAYEAAKNDAGEYAAQAAKILERVSNHKQKKVYAEGKLPDGHRLSRAKRYAVKIFLSHWWEQAYWFHHGTEPPVPFAIGKLSHAHYIEPEVKIEKKKVD